MSGREAGRALLFYRERNLHVPGIVIIISYIIIVNWRQHFADHVQSVRLEIYGMHLLSPTKTYLRLTALQ